MIKQTIKYGVITYFGYILAIAVGLTMGIMGSGGSILTLPIFVYLFHLAPAQALDYSLFTISTISLIGSISHLQKRDRSQNEFIFYPSIINICLHHQAIHTPKHSRAFSNLSDDDA